jgi:hypothetical protein
MTLPYSIIDKCLRAAFVKHGDEMLRVVAFDEDELIMYVEDEITGDEYALDGLELEVSTTFYEVKEIQEIK